MLFKSQLAVHPMKETTSEHLRTADKLVRLKRYEEALVELETAHSIDPQDVHTRAFLERTKFLLEKEQEKRSRVFGDSEMTSEQRMATIDQLYATIELFISEKKYPKALNELAKVYRIDPRNYLAQSFSDRIRALMHAETARKKLKNSEESLPEAVPDILQPGTSSTPVKEELPPHHPAETIAPVQEEVSEERLEESPIVAQEQIPKQQPAPRKILLQEEQPSPPPMRLVITGKEERSATLPVRPTVSHREETDIRPSPPSVPPFPPPSEQLEELYRYALYKELLKECWSDGLISSDESQFLHQARAQYSIPFDIHCQIEVEIKIDAYVDALRMVWLNDVVNENEQEVLAIMRRKYGISHEEQAAAEKKFSALLKSKKANAIILIVDNDYDNSIFLARVLMSHGYDVKIERHPDDAYQFLNSHTPDLILSEAVFSQGRTDGFEFFQRFRSEVRYSHIPFLIMTDSNDDHIIRAGLRMGVDYVIPKPLQINFVVSLIAGKIKSGLKPFSEKHYFS
jgi:CheY-like chemotaxis protein